MLRAENSGFSRNRSVTRLMNKSLATRSDAELAHILQPLDKAREIFLARRFRPFAQPRQWRSAPFVDNGE